MEEAFELHHGWWIGLADKVYGYCLSGEETSITNITNVGFGSQNLPQSPSRFYSFSLATLVGKMSMLLKAGPVGTNNGPWLGLLRKGASQVALVVRNLPANAGDSRDVGLISRYQVAIYVWILEDLMQLTSGLSVIQLLFFSFTFLVFFPSFCPLLLSFPSAFLAGFSPLNKKRIYRLFMQHKQNDGRSCLLLKEFLK